MVNLSQARPKILPCLGGLASHGGPDKGAKPRLTARDPSRFLQLLLQGISYWSLISKSALRARRIHNFIELRCFVGSRGLGICVSSTNFQKSNIAWPQQPLTERLLKINMIYPDSTQFFFFKTSKYRTEFKNLDDSEVLSSDFLGLKTSVASMASTGSTTSMASMTFNSLISSKKITAPDGWIPLATKSPILVYFFGMDHQKPKFSLISVPFLSEAVEVSRYYFFENWLMKLKYPNLRISEPPSNKL